MNCKTVLLILLSLGVADFVNCDTKVAEATLQAGNINGTVTFTETEQGIHVTGVITGLPAGLYGFHIHEIGDVSTCDAAGPHFNPIGNNHGGRDHQTRHVGDLGNVQFVTADNGSGVAYINFVDTMIAFNGTNNILNRTLVLHEQEDDLGLGGHETSLTTGNAGARIACGIIRVASGVGSMSLSLTVIALAVLLKAITL